MFSDYSHLFWAVNTGLTEVLTTSLVFLLFIHTVSLSVHLQQLSRTAQLLKMMEILIWSTNQICRRFYTHNFTLTIHSQFYTQSQKKRNFFEVAFLLEESVYQWLWGYTWLQVTWPLPWAPGKIQEEKLRSFETEWRNNWPRGRRAPIPVSYIVKCSGDIDFWAHLCIFCGLICITFCLCVHMDLTKNQTG